MSANIVCSWCSQPLRWNYAMFVTLQVSVWMSNMFLQKSLKTTKGETVTANLKVEVVQWQSDKLRWLCVPSPNFYTQFKSPEYIHYAVRTPCLTKPQPDSIYSQEQSVAFVLKSCIRWPHSHSIYHHLYPTLKRTSKKKSVCCFSPASYIYQQKNLKTISICCFVLL